MADRLRALCPSSGKVVVLGQAFGWPAVHYSGHLGWVEECRNLPVRWRERLCDYHRMGAATVAVYFDPSVPIRVRQTYRPMLDSLAILEHRSGPWFRRGQPCEYYILDLRNLDPRDPTAPRPTSTIAAAPAASPAR